MPDPTMPPLRPSAEQPTRYYADGSVTLHHGDCLDVLRTIPDASVDAVVTDPPYGLGFMGKAWDAAFMVETTERRRQYGGDPSPKAGENGGYRSAAAEAGRYDLSPTGNRGFGAWCEAWTAECLRVLKPGGHLLTFGGSRTWHRLACAVEDAGFEVRDSIAWLYGSGFPKSHNLGGDWQGWGTALKPAFEPIVVGRKPVPGTVAANVLAHGTGALNIDGCRVGTDTLTTHSRGKSTSFPKRPGETTVEESGRTQRQDEFARSDRVGRWPANVVLDESQAVELDKQSAGGASRFFYVAKAPARERPKIDGVGHPTVKPLDLMRWLVRLVTPPGGTVLEPFAGSGTTAEACVIEGFQCIAVEREEAYLPLIVTRLSKHVQPDLFGGAA